MKGVFYRKDNPQLYDDIIATARNIVDDSNSSAEWTANLPEKRIIEFEQKNGAIPCELVYSIIATGKDLSGVEQFTNLRQLEIGTNADLNTIGGKLDNLDDLTIDGCSSVNENFNYRQMAKLAPNVTSLTLNPMPKKLESDKIVADKGRFKELVDDFVSTKGDPSWSELFKKYLLHAKFTQASFRPIDVSDVAYLKNLKYFHSYHPIKELDFTKLSKLQAANLHKGAEKVTGLDEFLKRKEACFDSKEEIKDLKIKDIDNLLKAFHSKLHILNYFDIMNGHTIEEFPKLLSNSNLSFSLGQGAGEDRYEPDELYKEIVPIIDFTNKLCKDCDTQQQKLEKIYDYCCSKFRYDENVSCSVKDNAFTLFKTHKCTCHGFSELFAIMCRSQGIEMHELRCNILPLGSEIDAGGHGINYMIDKDEAGKDRVFVFDITNDLKVMPLKVVGVRGKLREIVHRPEYLHFRQTIPEYLASMNYVAGRRDKALKKERESVQKGKKSEIDYSEVRKAADPERNPMIFLAVNEDELVKNNQEREARLKASNSASIKPKIKEDIKV